jgi:hypothetical protein
MVTPERLQQMWADYFVVTFVRNPYQRAVSSYRMLSRYMARTCEPLVGGWNTVCMDLNHLGRLHHNHPECTLHKWVPHCSAAALPACLAVPCCRRRCWLVPGCLW